MVFYFTSRHEDIDYVIYMGKDKFENEDLIKHGFNRDIWFHVDDLSSAHVYIRLPETAAFDVNSLPKQLLIDCAQLTKANSIEGSKLSNVRIVYTMWSNLHKSGSMLVGQIGFHSEKQRKFTLVEVKENAIINRLNKTKSEVTISEHIERKQLIELELRKREKEAKKEIAEAEAKQKLEFQKQKDARSYEHLYATADMISNAEVAYKAQVKKNGKKKSSSSSSSAAGEESEEEESGNNADDFDFM